MTGVVSTISGFPFCAGGFIAGASSVAGLLVFGFCFAISACCVVACFGETGLRTTVASSPTSAELTAAVVGIDISVDGDSLASPMTVLTGFLVASVEGTNLACSSLATENSVVSSVTTGASLLGADSGCVSVLLTAEVAGVTGVTVLPSNSLTETVFASSAGWTGVGCLALVAGVSAGRVA